MDFFELITAALLVFAMVFVLLYFGRWARPPGPDYAQQFKDTLGVFAGFLGLALGFFFQQGRTDDARSVATDAVVQLQHVERLLEQFEAEPGPAGDRVMHVPGPVADSIRRAIAAPLQPSWLKARLPEEVRRVSPQR